MKTQRKKQIAAEKRARMSTGGGPFSPGSADNPIIDLATNLVDVEIPNVIDSDTICLVEASQCSAYTISQDEVLIPVEVPKAHSSKHEQTCHPGKYFFGEYEVFINDMN